MRISLFLAFGLVACGAEDPTQAHATRDYSEIVRTDYFDPDLPMEPEPGFFVDHSDRILERAMELIRASSSESGGLR